MIPVRGVCRGNSAKIELAAQVQKSTHSFVVRSLKRMSSSLLEGISVKLRGLYYASIAETISWIGLIVGMVMKYGFDNGSGTNVFGPIHGMLFVTYVVLTLLCHAEYKWPLKRMAFVLLAAIPPFVGFLVVHGLIKETQDETVTASLAS